MLIVFLNFSGFLFLITLSYFFIVSWAMRGLSRINGTSLSLPEYFNFSSLNNELFWNGGFRSLIPWKLGRYSFGLLPPVVLGISKGSSSSKTPNQFKYPLSILLLVFLKLFLFNYLPNILFKVIYLNSTSECLRIEKTDKIKFWIIFFLCWGLPK